jgi:hypothetical protein
MFCAMKSVTYEVLTGERYVFMKQGIKEVVRIPRMTAGREMPLTGVK